MIFEKKKLKIKKNHRSLILKNSPLLKQFSDNNILIIISSFERIISVKSKRFFYI